MKKLVILMFCLVSTLGFSQTQGPVSIIRTRTGAPGTCANTSGSVYWDTTLIRLGACRITNGFDYMPWLNASNPWQGFQDFSNATMGLPKAGGLTETTDGMIGFDTTLKNYHASVNAVDNVFPTVPPATPINGHLSKWVVASGNIQLGDVEFSDVKVIPAANCNNATAGASWSLPATSAPTAACRAGTNNLGGVLQFADAANAQFEVEIPADWDTSTNPFINLFFTNGSNTSGTLIFNAAVSCYKADGSTTDDVAFQTSQAFATVTASVANSAWSKNLQFNGTSMTNCVAGGSMIIKITRATDTAASAANISKAVLTFPRLVTLQAN